MELKMTEMEGRLGKRLDDLKQTLEKSSQFSSPGKCGVSQVLYNCNVNNNYASDSNR